MVFAYAKPLHKLLKNWFDSILVAQKTKFIYQVPEVKLLDKYLTDHFFIFHKFTMRVTVFD